MTIQFQRVESAPRSRADEAQPVRTAMRWGLAMLLSFVLMGCGQQKADAPAPRAEPPRQKPKPALPDKTVSKPVRAAAELPAAGRLPVFELTMKPKDLAALEQAGFSNDTHPATFSANGVVYEGVHVRLRGAWARTWPKPPFKILFNHDQLFDGRRCLNLNSGWRDPAFVRETLAYQVYAACGVPAPKSQMVRLNVNGRFGGLYVEVEQPDKAFLSRLHLKGAAIFKAVSKSNQADERDLGAEGAYSVHYDPETQKTDGVSELQRFCHDLAGAKNVLKFFTQRVDLDNYINYLAATVLVQHWDCFNKNHFLLYDGRGSKKWSVVPWDLDRTFGDHWQGGFNSAALPILLGTQALPGPTGWNRMEARFFSEPVLRQRLCNRLRELLEKEFTTEKLFPILDRLEADIAPDAALDRRRWPSPTPDLHGGIAEVKSYIKRRRAYLLGELGRL